MGCSQPAFNVSISLRPSSYLIREGLGPAISKTCMMSLLCGIVDTGLTKLQYIPDRLACLVTMSPPLTCSVPLVRSLHWLPVELSTLFNISLFTYKTLREKQPVYLHSMLAASIPSRLLRSNKGISLLVPRVKTNTGARAFTLVLPLLGTTSRCLSVQPLQMLF